MRPRRILDLCAGAEGWARVARERGHQVISLDINPVFGTDLVMDVREFARDPQRYLDEVAIRKGWIQPGEHWVPELIVASPPCEGYSVASMGKMWDEEATGVPVPKHPTSRLGLEILDAVLAVIDAFPNVPYVIENPRGMMVRVLEAKRGWRPDWVTYCKYGQTNQKPSRIWHRGLPGLKLNPPCTGSPKNGLAKMPKAGEPVILPRGTQPEVRKGRTWLVYQDGREEESTDPIFVLDNDGNPCHESSSRGARTGTQGMSGSVERAIIPRELALSVCQAMETTHPEPSAPAAGNPSTPTTPTRTAAGPAAKTTQSRLARWGKTDTIPSEGE